MRSHGAKVAASARELGAHAQLLEVSIAGDGAIESALLGPDGVLAGMAPDSVIALHSTMGPPAVRRIAAAAESANVHVVDAQVSGGKAGAHAHQLCYMIGGDAAIESALPSGVRDVRQPICFIWGPAGSGASTKLSQQMMTCMHIVAVAEGARIATAAGVDVDQFFALLRVSTGQSYIADLGASISATRRAI